MIDFWGIGYDVAERMNLIPQLRDVGYLIDHVKFVNDGGLTRSGFDAEILRRAVGNRFFSLPRRDLAEAIFNIVADKIETISATASLPFVKIEPASMFNSKTAAHDDSI